MLPFPFDGEDALFPVLPAKYNKKSWTLYIRQTEEESERCREEGLARDLGT